jgi:hypothetical protein
VSAVADPTPTPYIPVEVAPVAPDELTQGFWDACREHVLTVQCCTSCGTFRQPPGVMCGNCHSPAWEWRPVSPHGTVYTYTIVTHAIHPRLADRVPYNVIVVELDDAPGCRLISNLVDTAPEDVRVGTPVEVAWEPFGDDIVLPRFRPRP